MARIENWAIVTDAGIYDAPELIKTRLTGFVYNHDNPRFHDGRAIKTSTLQFFDLEGGLAATRNTTYELGEPSKEWKEWINDRRI